MHVKIDARELASGLKVPASVAAGGPAAIPILRAVRLEASAADGGRLRLQAMDGARQVRLWRGAQVIHEGVAVVDCADLLRAASGAAGIVDLHAGDTRMTARGQGLSTWLPTLDAGAVWGSDWQEGVAHSATVPAQRLAQALAVAVEAASTDAAMTNLRGVLIHVNERGLRLLATDGKVAHVLQLGGEPGSGRVMVSADVAPARWQLGGDVRRDIAPTARRFRAVGAGVEIQAQALDDAFPLVEMDRLFERARQAAVATTTVDAAALAAACKRVAWAGEGKQGAIWWQIGPRRLRVVAVDSDAALEAAADVAVEHGPAQPQEMSLVPRQIASFASRFAGRIRLLVPPDATRPVLVEGEQHQGALVPLRASQRPRALDAEAVPEAPAPAPGREGETPAEPARPEARKRRRARAGASAGESA